MSRQIKLNLYTPPELTLGEQMNLDDLVKEGIVPPRFPWRKDRVVLRRHLYGIAMYWLRFKVGVGRFSQELMDDALDEENWETRSDDLVYRALKDMDIYVPDSLDELGMEKEVSIQFLYRVVGKIMKNELIGTDGSFRNPHAILNLGAVLSHLHLLVFKRIFMNDGRTMSIAQVANINTETKARFDISYFKQML